MSVASEQLMVKMPESKGARVHRTVNRWLASVALVFGIFLMGVASYVIVALYSAASEVSDTLDQLTSTGETSETVEEPVEVNDGGQNYYPTPVAPDPSDPYAADNLGFDDPYGPDGYIGDTNPDGSPCVGYGCTPEMDAEILQGEAEANN